MSRYRMQLCQACFDIRANFPSIPFNTTYLTIDDNFYLIHSFFHLQNDKSRYSDLSYLLIWSNCSFISSLPLCFKCSFSCCVVAWDLLLPYIYGDLRKDKFSIREKLDIIKRYESYANKICVKFKEQ